MTVKAKYQFDPDVVAKLDATIKVTMSVTDWRSLKKWIASEQKLMSDQGQRLPESAVGLLHCVTNLVSAIDDATGHGYHTRGYTYEYEVEPTPSIPTSEGEK